MDFLLVILLIVLFLGFVAYLYLANQQKTKHQDPKPLNSYRNYTLTDFDLNLIRLINEYRVSLNLFELKESSHLSNVSYSHSIYMSKKGKISHDFAVNRQAEFPNSNMGEVVAYNYINPESVLEAWKKSVMHNQTILNIDYKFIGLSHKTNEQGKKYICALFIS